MPFTITFRAKVQECNYTDGTIASRYIRVPKLTRSHVDMEAARRHKRWGSFANSDLFQNILAREAVAAGCKIVGGGMRVDLLSPLPSAISIDTSGFLAQVTITVQD